MARSVTVIVEMIDSSSQRHVAGVDINTGSTTWVKSEPSGANEVFKTKTGPYRVIGTSTELLRAGGGLRVGRLENLVPDSVTNHAAGKGLSDDAGLAVKWKVDGIAEI